MAAPVFIGDEWTAAGWRLAGCEIDCPEPTPEAVLASVDRALSAGAALLLIGGDFAELLPSSRLASLRTSLEPPAVVVGDAAARSHRDEVTGDIRERMGVAR